MSVKPTGPAILELIPYFYQNEMTANVRKRLPNDYNLNAIQRFRIRRESNYHCFFFEFDVSSAPSKLVDVDGLTRLRVDHFDSADHNKYREVTNTRGYEQAADA